MDLVGWITLKNDSGKTFENAKIKLMAGDVNKVQPPARPAPSFQGAIAGIFPGAQMMPPPVTEQAFDEFHLYDIARATTLHDRETKQVEFVHAENMLAPTIYVYDGASGYRFSGGLTTAQNYGITRNKKVAVMREFVNAETNHLGVALPKGRLRFYRRDTDSQLQFVGENEIDHTPREETIRVTTGDSFDLVGERKATNFRMGSSEKWMNETFEIKLRNRKKEPVEIRVVEHLYRWSNWDITAKSNDFKKTDAQTIEFRIPVKPDEERTVTYTVHYSW